MKGKTNQNIYLVIGIIAILGLFLYNQNNKTILPNQECPNGQFCYTIDQTLYAANGVSTLPNNGILEVSKLCQNANPTYRTCYAFSVCPNCIDNKISCACQK